MDQEMMIEVGGGGSGYVLTSSSSKPSGYLLGSEYYLSDASTKAGNTSFPAVSGGNETGHTGNGYAKISSSSGSSGFLYEKYMKQICYDEAGTTAVSSVVIPTKTGFIFDGFYTETNGNGTQLIDSSGVITSNFTPSLFGRDSTIYANWKEKEIIYLDYMTFTGTQYIDTKIKPNQDTKAEIKFKVTNGTNALFGCREAGAADSKQRFYMLSSFSPSDTLAFGFGSTRGKLDGQYADTELHTYTLDKTGGYADGVSKISYPEDTFQSTRSIYLGCLYENNAILSGYVMKGQVYYFKVWQNDELVMDLVPIINKSDEYCFLDKVSGTEFKNAGSGTFTGA